jgi:hypothetical protein
MSRFGVPLLIAVALGCGFAGCGSSGVGINECRTVEEARCSAAASCDVGLDTASKRVECTRYSRDHCLHGLPGDVPHPSTLDRCVKAINVAGNCARRQGGDTLAGDCVALEGSVASDRTTVCDIIDAPEASSECAFLTATPVKEQDAGKERPKDAAID